ncbi:hypothetical protein Pcinc_036970 [Petrolisthes cinctipes]|uniref:POPDC1-3 domain-containing protein n=1 Tax=Petrolisthes cinctipes TaxID=88211 RepID=A0AAE1BXH3_PETCI|nr:hypothetical protein Pcinc_036970 [Petrolisthes cinctipes]
MGEAGGGSQVPDEDYSGDGDRLGTLYNDSGGTLESDLSWAEGYNDSTASFNLTGAMYAMTNSSNLTTAPYSNATPGNTSEAGNAERIEYCTEWPGATLTLFQVANFFCLLAFLVPHNFRLSGLVMRSILCVGILLFTLWAGLDICAVDILAWNMSFLLVNAGHVLYLTYTVWPPRVHKDMFDLYDKMFRPLRVNRQNFRHLVKEASVRWLEAGDTYAVEDITPADERLSVLLTGKLRVTCDSTHLHYILPNQFIDSPEWEAFADTSDELFQVSIMAEERSQYLCWPRPRLRHVLNLRPFLRAVIHNLIGKDITTKLYSLNEQLGVGTGDIGRAGSQDVWRGVVQRSMSLDTVHTGTKGFVRSLAWRASHRRTSASLCDSARSSPGHSGGSHCSDPPHREHPSPTTTTTQARHTTPPSRHTPPSSRHHQTKQHFLQQKQQYAHSPQLQQRQGQPQQYYPNSPQTQHKQYPHSPQTQHKQYPHSPQTQHKQYPHSPHQQHRQIQQQQYFQHSPQPQYKQYHPLSPQQQQRQTQQPSQHFPLSPQQQQKQQHLHKQQQPQNRYQLQLQPQQSQQDKRSPGRGTRQGGQDTTVRCVVSLQAEAGPVLPSQALDSLLETSV